MLNARERRIFKTQGDHGRYPPGKCYGADPLSYDIQEFEDKLVVTFANEAAMNVLKQLSMQ